jgi:L-aspartate oxidase
VGIQFSKSEEGKIDYTEEAAHSTRRIVHYEDHTGDKIEDSLVNYARKLGVEFLPDHTAIDLITNNHHSRDPQEVYREREVFGVYALNNFRGEIETFFSSKVVLATGGTGNLYYHSTNPVSATGDGVSMAHRAGANIINSEFIQFHPTSLFHKDIKRFLISESLRGEGARIKDHEGNEFMSQYSPMGDLAPRDVVSRAVYDQLGKKGKEYMLLDIASYYKGSVPLKERFSRIYTTCLKGGIDITKEPIPITPAAHYYCGGIKTDKAAEHRLKIFMPWVKFPVPDCTGQTGLHQHRCSRDCCGANHLPAILTKNFREIKRQRFDNIPDWETPAMPRHLIRC